MDPEAYYAVRFFDGTELKNVIYVKDKTQAKEPEALTKDGYSFAGWVTEDGGGTKFDFSQNIHHITDVYASWTAAHVHNWSTAWTGSATHHWHECTAQGCEITEDAGKNGYEAHAYDGADGRKCNVCGYLNTGTITGNDWSLDANGKLIIESDAGMISWSNEGRSKYRMNVVHAELGSSVTSIGEDAFKFCGALQSVTLKGSNPPELGWDAFAQCGFVGGSNQAIHVPAGVGKTSLWM